jgi:hypothetical protein
MQYQSVNTQTLPIRAVSNLLEKRGDICSSKHTTGVIDTCGKWKKSSIMVSNI